MNFKFFMKSICVLFLLPVHNQEITIKFNVRKLWSFACGHLSFSFLLFLNVIFFSQNGLSTLATKIRFMSGVSILVYWFISAPKYILIVVALKYILKLGSMSLQMCSFSRLPHYFESFATSNGFRLDFFYFCKGTSLRFW
jgi:hypothetical protein